MTNRNTKNVMLEAISMLILMLASSGTVQAGEIWTIQDFNVVADFPDHIIAGSTFNLDYTFESAQEVPLQVILNISEAHIVNEGEWFVGINLDGNVIGNSEISGGNFSTDESNISTGKHELKITISSRPDILPSTYNFTIVVLSSKVVVYSKSSTIGGGSGGGGGTGGIGVITCEDLNNIEKSETQTKNLITDMSTVYNLSDMKPGIYEISVIGKGNESDVALRVELLKNASVCVGKPAPEIVYKYSNAWIGSPMIKGVVVRFKVENPWIEDNDISVKDINLYKWNKNTKEWVKLETVLTNKDGEYTYFESNAESLSPFAISGARSPPPGITPVVTEKQVNTTSPKPKTGSLIPWLRLALIIILIGSVSYYVYMRSKK